MLSLEIENKLKNLKNFHGVFSRDTLPIIKSYPASLIANVDTHDLKGSHWIAIYINNDGFGEYFDSYGLPPLYFEFLDFLQKYTKKFIWNKIALQCTSCITCGHYSIVYIVLRSQDISYKNFISLFSANKFNNDIIIKNIFRTL